MKKLKLHFQHLTLDEVLTREQLKLVIGGDGYGYGGGAPQEPQGGGVGHKNFYKCCWSGTNQCSPCVPCEAQCLCMSGSTISYCFSM